MRCQECDSDDLIRQYGKDMYFSMSCYDCGAAVTTGRQCDRCDRTDADVFVANITDVFPNEMTGRRRTRRRKIRRCPDCATRIPERWVKRNVAQG